ncbi:MAG: hypothetical protein JWO38_3261 [Gemmataceae bacterium]|nr:hypothetical protein [Gemmataceae bacterium]
MTGSYLGARASRPPLPRSGSVFAVLILALGGLSTLAARAGPGVPATPTGPAQDPATTQDLILFTADGPVRLRLAVTLGGKPAVGPWRAALDALFDHCDRDGDGGLSVKERESFQHTARQGLSEFVVVDGPAYVSSRMPVVTFPERGGKVDRAGFHAGFELAGLGPVSVAPVAARSDSQALTDALFKHLDRDGDGKLSAAELKAARDRLAALDANEDEVVTPDELLGRAQNPVYQLVEVVDFDLTTSYGGRRRAGPPPLPDVMMPPAGKTAGVKDVLAARDADKDGALSPAELGCAAGAIADLDADGDGRLDADELAAWLRQPPDLDLAFDLPARSGGAWMAVAYARSSPGWTGAVKLSAKGRLADRVKPEGDEAMRAVLPSTRVRFLADGGAGSAARRQWEGSAKTLRTAFTLVAGTKGAVERNQLIENPDLAGALTLFDFADRNGDGKVTKDELDGAIRTGGTVVNCRAAVEVADLGRGLFELLDRDGDGRLSPREMNAAAGLLAALDRDGDGKLSRTEIPRGYAVTAKPASVDLVPTNVTFDGAVAIYGASRATRTVSVGHAPEWFRNADRNEDGDVSAREFPGPPALFKRIDTDGDGLISPEEALAFEKVTSGKPR